jgi:hypothetical protein
MSRSTRRLHGPFVTRWRLVLELAELRPRIGLVGDTYLEQGLVAPGDPILRR